MPDIYVSAYKRIDWSGKWVTDIVVKDGERHFSKTVRTHPSQIPVHRESLLWKPAVKGIPQSTVDMVYGMLND